MTELNFFIRFLKDRNIYNLFFQRVIEQNSIRFLYKNLLKYSNDTESLIFLLINWSDTFEGSDYWFYLYHEYLSYKKENWSVSSMDRM